MIGRLKARTVKLQETPDLVGLVPPDQGIAWLTSGTSLVATGECLRVDPGTGPSRFGGPAEEVESLLADAVVEDEVDLPGSGPIAFGSWTFDPESAGSAIVVPATVYGTGEGVAWKTTLSWVDDTRDRFAEGSSQGPPPGTVQNTPPERRGAAPVSPSNSGDDWEEGWADAVKSALEAIRAGLLTKVVLAREVVVTAPQPFEPRKVLTRLVSAYPGCFNFWFDHLVGASPELLLRRLGDVVDSIPLAGSTRRGADDEEDAELGRQLKASPKDLTEHHLTVQTVMDSLAPYCLDLVAEAEPSLLLLANMQHLSTKVQGHLKASPSALDLVEAIHPTAAVCGVPEDRAMDLIRSIERFSRGRYAGPIGWMDHKGDGEWAVALRCAELDGMRARVFAGAGIVAGSDPQGELEETDLKLRAMLSALQPPD